MMSNAIFPGCEVWASLMLFLYSFSKYFISCTRNVLFLSNISFYYCNENNVYFFLFLQVLFDCFYLQFSLGSFLHYNSFGNYISVGKCLFFKIYFCGRFL